MHAIPLRLYTDDDLIKCTHDTPTLQYMTQQKPPRIRKVTMNTHPIAHFLIPRDLAVVADIPAFV